MQKKRDRICLFNARISDQTRDFGLRQAEQLLALGKAALGFSDAQIGRPERGDLRRAANDRLIWTTTAVVPQKWIAEALDLKSAANSSQQIRRFAAIPPRRRTKSIQKWIADVLKNVD